MNSRFYSLTALLAFSIVCYGETIKDDLGRKFLVVRASEKNQEIEYSYDNEVVSIDEVRERAITSENEQGTTNLVFIVYEKAIDRIEVMENISALGNGQKSIYFVFQHGNELIGVNANDLSLKVVGDE